MWNWLRTPISESALKRIRNLERTVDDLAADVTLTSERLVRLEARLRARARKQLADAPPDGDLDSDVDRPSARAAAGEAAATADGRPALVEGDDRSSMREQLRNNARARGLLPGRTG